MHKHIYLPFLLVLFSASLRSQTEAVPNLDSLNRQLSEIRKDVLASKNLKVTGWTQIQFQYAESRGTANFEGGNFAVNSDKRFFIRRGRVKFTHKGKNSLNVMQINATERGMNIVEIYSGITEPWTKSWSIVAGIMNRPFGYEIEQSSSVRESPERSRYTQILMPNERDLGAKIAYAAPKESRLSGLRLDAGFYNGQGIYVPGPSTPAGFPAGTIPVLGLTDFDFQKDFIGRLSYYKTVHDKYTFGLGTSHYNGGIINQNNRVFDNTAKQGNGDLTWTLADTSSKVYRNRVSPRVYYGGELFLSRKFSWGQTTIRGEYITGVQPGTLGSSASPFFLNTSSPDTYLRNFNGMYVYFIQRLRKHEMALKYEFYDPNTKVTGKNIIAANGFSAADIRYEQIGITYTNYTTENVLFMFHYNIVKNEATSLSGFRNDLKDNIFTVRMQYKF